METKNQEFKDIPVRTLKIYQTDDGRKIEEWTKTGQVSFPTNDVKDGYPEINQEIIYIGVATVVVNTENGPISREIKYEIPASSYQDALLKYSEYARKTIESYKKMMDEQKANLEKNAAKTGDKNA